MEKRISSVVLIFLACLLGENVFAREEDDLFSNLLLEESIDEAQCDQMQMEVSAMDSATSVDSVPRLLGKWVSRECEVRPGPEFLLRSYYFTKNNSFRLLQYFYEDQSCILPMYTVIAKGKLFLKEPSWVTPSGTESEFTLTRVTIIPHTTEVADRLSREIRHKCSDWTKKTWKPHREYIVYNSRDFEEISIPYKTRRRVGKYRKRKVHKDVDCLSAIGVEFNELMLIRTQWRPVEDHKRNRELLLGDIHSRKEDRFTYKPTAFQVPLLKSDQAHDCVNCHTIAKGTERAPPHLLSKPHLPPLPHGQWISQRCEVRPLGMFLTRRLSFDSRDHTWIGEYKFHSDPFCTESAFAISASGKYLIGSVQNKEKYIRKQRTGANFDFQIEEASLTLYDPTLRDTFSTETNCGVGHWYVGIAKELSPTSGCAILGIVLPSVEYELIKLELDNRGTPLLLFGLPDTENKKRSVSERPTSYQAPLVQCSVFPQQNAFNNHLEPISYARTAPRSSSSALVSSSGLIFLFLVPIIVNLRQLVIFQLVKL